MSYSIINDFCCISPGGAVTFMSAARPPNIGEDTASGGGRKKIRGRLRFRRRIPAAGCIFNKNAPQYARVNVRGVLKSNGLA